MVRLHFPVELAELLLEQGWLAEAGAEVGAGAKLSVGQAELPLSVSVGLAVQEEGEHTEELVGQVEEMLQG